MIRLFLLFISFLFLEANAQNKMSDLPMYYPTEWDDPLEIKVMVHVFHYKKEEPKNFVEADTVIIQQHFENVNAFYSSFDRPTLVPDELKDIPFIFDSKIRFKLEGIKFYVDSVSWLRWSRELNTSGGFPYSIDSIIENKNVIAFSGIGPMAFKKNITKISIIESEFNDGDYEVDSAWNNRKITFLRLKGNALKKGNSLGKFSYEIDKNKNCDSDIWKNVMNENKDYIHIFATGTHDPEQGFGCGPSPYYLNMTNWGPTYKWVGSQLMAHEIGHCIGLNHTDFPQFDDLPKKDKFGWYQCDSTEVSNNIMGYNICRRYLSPKQIAFVHKLYTSDPARIRTTTQCNFDKDETIIVRFNKNIEKHTVFRGNIVVKKKKTLTISKNCFLTEQSTIYLERGAKLILEDANLASACQTKWNGVVKCKKVKKGKAIGSGNGEVILKGNAKVLEVK